MKISAQFIRFRLLSTFFRLKLEAKLRRARLSCEDNVRIIDGFQILADESRTTSELLPVL